MGPVLVSPAPWTVNQTMPPMVGASQTPTLSSDELGAQAYPTDIYNIFLWHLIIHVPMYQCTNVPHTSMCSTYKTLPNGSGEPRALPMAPQLPN